ncbi:MAG TPA: hypothetical protein VGS19_16925 [Streptosporangiaceae bacterium]|nr:hypothetical protein [Streptosporangiaceae bacterium]
MPRQKDFTRLVRSRMATTGESCTTAHPGSGHMAPPPPATPAPQQRHTTRRLTRAWAGWLALAVIQNGIWLACRLSGQGDQSYWPIWVMLPWGAVLLAHTVWTVAIGKRLEG